MAWVTPKTDWDINPKGIDNSDLNRWEGNIALLKSAPNIDIVDAGGYFTGTTVEDALSELKDKI